MMARSDFGDPTPASTAYIGVIGSLVFLLIVIYLTALYYQSEGRQQELKTIGVGVATVTVRRVEDNRREQRKALEQYGYDHAYSNGEGRVSIPVEEAKRKLLVEWKQRHEEPSSGGSGE